MRRGLDFFDALAILNRIFQLDTSRVTTTVLEFSSELTPILQEIDGALKSMGERPSLTRCLNPRSTEGGWEFLLLSPSCASTRLDVCGASLVELAEAVWVVSNYWLATPDATRRRKPDFNFGLSLARQAGEATWSAVLLQMNE